MIFWKKLSLIISIGLGTFYSSIPAAEAFTFIEIANSATSDFTDVDLSAYSLNDLGEVAFVAELDGLNGIFSGDGSSVSTLVDPSEGFNTVSFLDINPAGTVVFNEVTVPGIFTSSGGIVTPIVTQATSAGQIGFEADTFVSPVINEAGAIAFRAENSGTFEKVLFVAEGGSFTEIAGTPQFDVFRFDLNNAGEIAFASGAAPAGEGAFLSDGVGAPVALPGLPDIPNFGTVEGPTLNDTGTLAFDLLFTDELDNPLQGIFLQNSEGLQLVVDNGGEFDTFGRPAINNSDDVVFAAELDAAPPALFAGPEPVTDRVIGVGDVLFGMPIVSLSFTQQTGLNNQGQIAFAAVFEDGSTGIFRADPEPDAASVPEPTSGITTILAMGIAGGLVRRRS